MRFSRGPPSTWIFRTTRWSTSTPASFCSALAMADFNSFSRSRQAYFGVARRIAAASLTFFPRMGSATSRTFWADPFMYRRRATAFILSSPLRLAGGGRRRCSRRSRSARGAAGLGACRVGLLAAVALEDPGRREFPELVADHVLGDLHGNE